MADFVQRGRAVPVIETERLRAIARAPSGGFRRLCGDVG